MRKLTWFKIDYFKINVSVRLQRKVVRFQNFLFLNIAIIILFCFSNYFYNII